MTEQTDYDEEIEQVADKIRNTTGFSPTLTEHLMSVGEYISWYTNKEGTPDKQDFESFNEDLINLIDETAKEDVALGDVALVLWIHLNNIEQMHRKNDNEENGSDSSENRAADPMFQ